MRQYAEKENISESTEGMDKCNKKTEYESNIHFKISELWWLQQ